jgi:hypothetical protein
MIDKKMGISIGFNANWYPNRVGSVDVEGV